MIVAISIGLAILAVALFGYYLGYSDGKEDVMDVLDGEDDTKPE